MIDYTIGDIVICVDSSPNIMAMGKQPEFLKLGGECKVHGLSMCTCGQVKVDIGVPSLNFNRCSCGKRSSPCGSWLLRAVRFRKKENLEDIKEEALKEENYELLHALK